VLKASWDAAASAAYELLLNRRVDWNVEEQQWMFSAEQKRVPPIVESPFKFIEVVVQVLRAHLMVSTYNGVLEKARHTFRGIRVEIAEG
jgi:hypothetical protein